ncbi:aldehyde dehydrogenase family protein [Rhodobacter sp. SGA-6-6]|uniref:aldehyde dehydrogenase family protein n=1 Tax=Rhodobacter sp. SGA-6-6 TaxID=2710882 RepID=UPI0013EE2EB5|nr:aldehyde dehydrogenase family protein [Rhodobacter sp. SGA-6-6]NGM44078.1 aldehyde dehydrogenase family protein [Rhodobacter sp. SGA-6-6]
MAKQTQSPASARRDAFRPLLDQDFGLLIGGECVPARDGARFDSIDPATGATLASLPNAGPEDLEAAIAAARRAWLGWKAMAYAERRALLLKVAAALRAHAAELGALDAFDTGNVLGGMQADVHYAADTIDYYASIGYEIKGETTTLDSDLHFTLREPYGIVARLLPFNHPIASFGIACAAPLLTGNCLILKPSPHSSLSALFAARLIAGILPPGVLSVLTGENDRIALPLVRHPAIDRLSLIGSTEAGKAIMREAAGNLVPLTLELGAKNPLIVFPDADLDEAAEIAVKGMNFGWQSASCGATSRALVHASVADAFAAKLAAKLAEVKVGDPFDPDSRMGSISFAALHRRVQDYIASGLADGAKLVFGGDRPEGVGEAGFYIRPALFTGTRPDMRIAREEIFGPVLTLLTWTDYPEMIATANELDLGLTACVMTNDLDQALRAAKDLEVGYVEVNGPVSWALGSPFGGWKQSGFGNEGSIDELLGYTRVKSVNIRIRR